MRLRIALLAALGTVVSASPAGAYTSANLISNPGAEGGPGATDASTTQDPPGWQVAGITAVAYGTSGFLTPAQSASWGGGTNFFAGGPGSFGDASVAVQQIDLTSEASQIDTGKVNVNLSGLIGGFGGQDDAMTVSAALIDQGGTTGTGLGIGPVTDADRGGQTNLLPKTACVAVPAGVRIAQVAITAQRTAGTYNDGYADNLELKLTDAACSTAEELPPAAPPVISTTANADIVSGKVKVKVPGSNRFVELSDASQIPIGSEVDATKGVVSIQTAADNKGTVQTGKFSQGTFTMSQPKATKPITEMRLTSALSCTSKPGVHAAARTRQLFGDTNKGRFRTRGRHATATVRGTQWVTKDSCKSTTVTVKRGTVTVRDLVKKKNVTVKRGHSYTARERNK